MLSKSCTFVSVRQGGADGYQYARNDTLYRKQNFMVYTTKFLITTFILFSCYSCNKRTEFVQTNQICDSTITSDPFKTFTPDIYTSVEQNNQYQEIKFSGVIPGGVRVNKRFYKDIQDSLKFVFSGYRGYNYLLEILRRIHLPENGKRLEINITYEYQPSQNEKEAFLEVVFFNKNKIEKKYTEIIPSTMRSGDDEEKIEKKSVTIAKYKYGIPRFANNVQATIRTHDKNKIEQQYRQNELDSGENMLKRMVYFTLKEFGFKIDGKPLEEFIYDNSIPFSKREIDEIHSKISDSLKINSNVKIVGIGESIHGNKAFYNHLNEIIKQLITEGFTVLGFEMSIIDGIKLNDYITGRNIDLDSILSKNYSYYVYNNQATKELFEYLRVYNQENNNTISIFGFDIPLIDKRGDLNDYSKIDFNISDFKLFNEYLKNFYNKYGHFYDNVLYYRLLHRHRDEIMSENISYIDNSFSETKKIVLAAHLGHLYKRESPDTSAGFLLSEKYGKQYEVIGLFTGKGDFLTNHYDGFNSERITKHFPLSTPIGKSLEQLCNEIDKNLFYINNSKEVGLLNKVMYSFYLGVLYRAMQFEPIDIIKEVDIVCFIKDSSSY